MAKPLPALRPAPRAALFLLAALAAPGCAHKNTLVGRWQGTPPGGATDSTFEFTQGGREAITSRTTSAGGAVDITAAGTYKVDGANLTQTLTTMTLRGHPMVIPPHPARPAPFTLGGDRLTLTNPGTGEPLTLTRVRE